MSIKQHVGKKVLVKLHDKRTVSGVLNFFNFDNRTIHISNATIRNPATRFFSKNTFLVINSDEWETLSVDEQLFDGTEE